MPQGPVFEWAIVRLGRGGKRLRVGFVPAHSEEEALALFRRTVGSLAEHWTLVAERIR